MKKIFIYPFAALALLIAGCAHETPFNPEEQTEGQILKSALDMSIAGQSIIVNDPTRADEYDINSFNIAFVKTGQTIASRTYRYGEMPDVVTLEAGEYKVSANYGEDREAEWENPYFLGESGVFEVTPLEITSYIDPIECELNNIKVTIAFDPMLAAAMSPESYVEVKVGDNNGLQFTSAEANAEKAGYFRHTNETTLVATFNGTIDNGNVIETKSYSGIEKGRWYKLTFKLHNGGGQGASGTIDTSVMVDASVRVKDVNANVEIADDEPLDDSERPKEGGDDNPDDPPTPPAEDAPEIVAAEDAPNLVFDQIWNVTDGDVVKFHVISHDEAGIQELTCDIISDALTDEELSGYGLSSHLNIAVTPPSQEDGLTGLGFPVNQKGQHDVLFDISSFVPMLQAIGAGQLHQFVLHVKDAKGECTKTLKLQF